MLQTLINRLIESVNSEQFSGQHAHNNGSSETALRLKRQEFLSGLDKIEHVIERMEPERFQEYNDAVKKSSLDRVTDCASDIQKWSSHSPQMKFSMLKRAAEKVGLELSDDENMISFSNETLLIDISKRSMDVQISVFSGEIVRAKLENEAKELSKAFKNEAFNECLEILRGIVHRTETISKQTRPPAPPASSNGRGWGGVKGIELSILPEDVPLDPIPKCFINYEVEVFNGEPKFFITIQPPLLVSPLVARHATNADFSNPFPSNEADLRDLTLALTNGKTSAVVNFETASTGQSIGLFSLGEHAGNHGEASQNNAPLFARLESHDCVKLDSSAPGFIRGLFQFNRLLMSCFVSPSTGLESSTGDNGSFSELKTILYSTEVTTYQRGLLLNVKGKVSMQLYIDALNLVVESVEGDGNYGVNQKDIISLSSKTLKSTLTIPAVLHACLFLCEGSSLGQHAKRVKLEQ